MHLRPVGVQLRHASHIDLLIPIKLSDRRQFVIPMMPGRERVHIFHHYPKTSLGFVSYWVSSERLILESLPDRRIRFAP